eukprot:4517424-Pleurochrysis_carterae.AAC.1
MRNGIAFPMHTQIGNEGQQIAHTLVIINTGMRTVPDSADQQVHRDRIPLLAKNDEVLAAVPRYAGGVEYADRAYFSWEPAAAF